MKEIIIEIDQTGNCSIDGKGFKGTECQRHISELQNAIGSTTCSKNKPEFHETNINKIKETTR